MLRFVVTLRLGFLACDFDDSSFGLAFLVVILVWFGVWVV